ncbi:MAG: hypothetical protein GY850_06860 [bacterium]|nr:hypothetical protein [bacterium]
MKDLNVQSFIRISRGRNTYYVKLQKLNLSDLHLVRITAVSLIFSPLSVAIRAQSESLAAWLKKPTTVLTGHGIKV